MHRNKYYLPSLKSGYVTMKYMNAVRYGKVYCPKYPDVRLEPCPVKPPKEECRE